MNFAAVIGELPPAFRQTEDQSYLTLALDPFHHVSNPPGAVSPETRSIVCRRFVVACSTFEAITISN